MQKAYQIAEMSKDPKTKVGAVIVDAEGKYISFGHNHLVSDKFTWDDKHPYVIHAEVDAIVSAYQSNRRMEGGTMFTTLFPCNECAKLIVQSGIKKLVYSDDSKMDRDYSKQSVLILSAVGIEVVKDDKSY